MNVFRGFPQYSNGACYCMCFNKCVSTIHILHNDQEIFELAGNYLLRLLLSSEPVI